MKFIDRLCDYLIQKCSHKALKSIDERVSLLEHALKQRAIIKTSNFKNFHDLIQKLTDLVMKDIKERGFAEAYKNPRPPSWYDIADENIIYVLASDHNPDLKKNQK